MKFKQRGRPTYRRDVIIGLFNDKAHRILLDEIGLEIISELQKGRYDLEMTSVRTKYGFRGNINLRFRLFDIKIGMYRDGWKMIFKPNISMKRKFDKLNTQDMWTQETKKVAPMVVEAVNEIELKLEDKNK